MQSGWYTEAHATLSDKHPMNSGRSHLISTVPAILLLFVSVFRLGDGPCGCPDHNAWIELVGIVADDVVDSCSHKSETPETENQWEHACDGVPLGHYVDNSRTPHVDEGQATYQLAAACPFETANQMAKSMCNPAPPPHYVVVLTRPALKVYQV